MHAFVAQQSASRRYWADQEQERPPLSMRFAGLVRPDAGRIVVGDRVLFDHRRKITLSPSQRQIGYVFQEAQLFPHMSVRDNLLYGWRRQCKSYPDHRSISFEAVITLMDLYHLLAERPVHLSGGEKQRVTIGRALLSQPSLLLLDEPLAALDTPRRDEILPYLECLSTELWLPMIYVSHSLDEVLHLADHLVLIENGQILVSGPPQVVLTDDIFCKMYGSNDFGTILEAEVRGEEENLTTLKVGEWLLRIPKIPSSCGTRLTLHIRARNVILSKSAPMTLSLINTVQGTIIGIQSQVSEARIHLDIKGVTLFALISLYSLQQMDLAEGEVVFVLINHITVKRKNLCRTHLAIQEKE